MNLFNTFPRKIGTPSKIVCMNAQDFETIYNKVNGVVNKVYINLYTCDEFGNSENVTLDKAALDIDWEHKYDTMVEVHNKLMKDNFIHQILFSTNGFWIYTACKPTVYPQALAKSKLAAMQEAMVEGTSAYFGKSKEAPLDYSIRGDIERLTRMPSSYDKIRKRFAIFLSQEDIDGGYDHICKVSENADMERRFRIITFCENGKMLNPEDYTAVPMRTNFAVNELSEEEYKFVLPLGISDQHKKIADTLPKFMQGWLNKEQANWQARAYITLYLRERGFSLQQTKDFLRPFFESHLRTDEFKNNWEHYCKVKVAELMYKRADLKFPSYKTLYEMGLCPYKYVEIYGGYSSPAYG